MIYIDTKESADLFDTVESSGLVVADATHGADRSVQKFNLVYDSMSDLADGRTLLEVDVIDDGSFQIIGGEEKARVDKFYPDVEGLVAGISKMVEEDKALHLKQVQELFSTKKTSPDDEAAPSSLAMILNASVAAEKKPTESAQFKPKPSSPKPM